MTNKQPTTATISTFSMFRRPLLAAASALLYYHLVGAAVTTPFYGDNFTLAGKTIYFLVTDRFARSGDRASNTTFCDAEVDWCNRTAGGGYCGGSIRGIEDRLDYIDGMGFDCIWITPVVKSLDYTGYTASNFSEIDPHFGTEEDLRSLADALHGRGMCLVVDIVTNHVQPLKVNHTFVLDGVSPFNGSENYHQYDIGPDQSFEDYVMTGTAPDPSSGFGNKTEYYAQVQEGTSRCGPDYPDSLLCSCLPGNSDCPDRSEDIQLEGWIGSTKQCAAGYADLDQDDDFVRAELFEYAEYLKSLGADAFRLDTAIYMKREFLRELQRSAGIDIIGETTVSNLTYHGSFQRSTDGDGGEGEGQTILKGVLNFPLFYYAPQAFCGYIMTDTYNVSSGGNSAQGTWVGSPNLTMLANVVDFQQTGNYYNNLDLLGNFLDNHDEYARIGRYCQRGGRDAPLDVSRVKNALTWWFFTRGIPIVYYGTEQGLAADQKSGDFDKRYANGGTALRESLWQTNYSTTTWQYQYIALLNRVRKEAGIGVGELKVENSTEQTLVFTRESDAVEGTPGPIWVFINNYGDDDVQEVVYCPGPPSHNNEQQDQLFAWKNILSSQDDDHKEETAIAIDDNGCYVAPDSEPKVLMLVHSSSNGDDDDGKDGTSSSPSILGRLGVVVLAAGLSLFTGL